MRLVGGLTYSHTCPTVSLYASRVVAGGRGGQLSILNFTKVRKFSSKNTKFGTESPPICGGGDLVCKIEILNTHISSVGNLQLQSVGKVQLSVPNL